MGRLITNEDQDLLLTAAIEVSKATQRGWQVCCQLSTLLFGLMLAYWMYVYSKAPCPLRLQANRKPLSNYGFYFYKGSVQWRFPLLFQLVLAAYILILTPFLPDTPRWLMRHDETHERGLLVLSRLRNKAMNDPAVQEEADGIIEAIRIEAKEEGSWGDLFRSNGVQAHKRFYLALGIQFMQQMSG